ncbi:choline ABC transporter substrate-binding protein [Aureimonas frigidaquae]|uniref:Glycine/betaine ABC transporter substrate-binding protein n=1 Tax=Aureimonas frigidaquae TaxID=424757 RepID=A0A0P0Z0T7_9HYPH|nr:choline ABC transporter substrate-binding protein [Aureimonas frigidaquae]BAT27342.1 glycine/betaine ABC transporter substrate-binding protein [Aureimonas frigidaquae]
MTRYALALAATIGLAGAAHAQDPQTCSTVRLSDPGWSDITSTNALASEVLAGLGYTPDVKTLSVPIGYQALGNKEIDVFLGNWMPAQTAFRKELDSRGAAEELTRNLTGAKFTLAVPSYVAQEGVRDVKDLSSNAQRFNSRIYGIEAGAPANENIEKMIADPAFGLSGWQLTASSEQGMLAQVQRAERRKEWVAFLAWAPHPMNTQFDITYLSGADDYFGPDYGGAEVFTLARTGYGQECPNAAKLFSQLVFSVDMENQMMEALAAGTEPRAAAKAWLAANPTVLDGWLDGVETLAGEPGLPAVKASIGG